MKVALIYDINTPYTTGVYFYRAFQELGFDVTLFHHNNVNDIEDIYQIYFIVDSGCEYTIPAWKSGPSFYYSIDTHLAFNSRFEMAKSAQFPVMAQLSCGAQKATDLGLPTLWVPLACDPWIHKDHCLERQYDISFVGHLYEDDVWRMTLKDRLIANGYTEDKIFIGEATKEEMGEIYSKSKIVVNNTVRDNKQDINMRVFEAMSCGAYLVTQKLDNNDMDRVIDSQLYSSYSTEQEMFNVFTDVLNNWDEKYREIALRGKLFVRTYHTYATHLKTLLSSIIGATK